MSTIATLKIFCFIGKPSQIMLISVQGIFMGFNQLARLHYCFSENSVHSAKCYPNWLFIIMIAIGSIILIMVLIYPWLWADELCASNGITDKYQWISPYSRDAPNVGLWINISMGVYIIWDFATLSLYIIKVLSFRRFKQQNEEVYNRIMFILKKVVILTVLYEIPALWCMASGTVYDSVSEIENEEESIVVIICAIFYRTSWQFGSIIINLSVCLMQSHNEKEYDLFLRLLYKLKVYYVCCGCRKIFIDAGSDIEAQLSLSVDSKSSVTQDPSTPSPSSPTTPRKRTGTIETLETAQDHSLKVDHSKVNHYNQPSDYNSDLYS